MSPFDKVVEVLILIGVWFGVWLEWKTLQQKTQQRIKRQVTKLLKSLRITTNA